MAKKLSIEEVRKYFKSKNCVLLSTEYINSHTKLEYIASCGHKHTIAYNSFRSGKGIECPKCSRNVESFEDVKEFFKNRGCELLSTEYKNTATKLEYIARCGHKREIAYNNFKKGQGSFCLACNGKELMTLKKVDKIFKDKNCKLLSTEYTNAHAKLKYIASCGHERSITFVSFKAGLGELCHQCSQQQVADKYRHTFDFVKNFFEERDCKLISKKYINCHSKLKYVAQCGHEETINFAHFQNGEGLVCKKCAGIRKYTIEEVKTYFKNNGCVLLSEKYVNSHSKLKYIAFCGHENEVSFSNFRSGSGLTCSKCFGSTGEKIIANVLNQNGVIYEQEKKMTGCKGKRELRFDFYIPTYNICIEYDGRQHFESIEYFGGEKQLIQQQTYDKIKNQYCLDNNIILIRIPYTFTEREIVFTLEQVLFSMNYSF
jgi:hypothetical protein